eukprot:6187311-Pleurochrysis_carterae.AAC.1
MRYVPTASRVEAKSAAFVVELNGSIGCIKAPDVVCFHCRETAWVCPALSNCTTTKRYLTPLFIA